jgi:hypothetical protein
VSWLRWLGAGFSAQSPVFDSRPGKGAFGQVFNQALCFSHAINRSVVKQNINVRMVAISQLIINEYTCIEIGNGGVTVCHAVICSATCPYLVAESEKSKYTKILLDYVCIVLWAGWCSRYSDWLRAGRSGNRIPVGARFSAPVQTGPGAHPDSCTMGTGSFSGINSSRGVTLTPHSFLVL